MKLFKRKINVYENTIEELYDAIIATDRETIQYIIGRMPYIVVGTIALMYILENDETCKGVPEWVI